MKTGQLNVHFQYLGGPEAGELPVVVDVLDADLEQAVAPSPVSVGAGWSQRLEPGTYLTRVTFPSGERITKTSTITPGGTATVDVNVHALSGQESLERPAVLRPLHRDEATDGLSGARFASAWLRRWERVPGAPWMPTRFDGTTASRDDHTVRYQFAFRSAPTRRPLPRDATSQQALEVGGPSLPWRFVLLPPSPLVDVTVTPRGALDVGIEVTTDNVDAEALLGYMRTGAMEGAEVMAERLLHDKRRDPIGAAIGGYYLLRVVNLKRLSWWGPNLSRWFPWLSDGAVVNGWQHIHSGRTTDGDPEHHFDEARNELLAATTRGVPIYTEGLRLLYDGLRLLAADGDGDAELADALQRVAPFAASADWTASTVIYGGEDPDHPDSLRRLGLPQNMDHVAMLQRVDIADLVGLGLLSADSRLVCQTDSGPVAAAVTDDGMEVEGLGTYASPEDTAPDVLGASHPEQSWYRWQVTRLGKAPRGQDLRRELGRRPSLADLRHAARG